MESETNFFDFSNFINELIENTMNAILASHINQEKRILEILEDLNLPKEELIEKYELLTSLEEIDQSGMSKEKASSFIDNYINDHKVIIQKFLEKGIPKVIIDKGSLNVKAVISVDDNVQNTKKGLEPKQKVTKTKKMNVKEYKSLQDKLSNKVFESKLLPTKGMSLTPKIKIKPLKENDQNSENTVDIISEINIEFKTVIE